MNHVNMGGMNGASGPMGGMPMLNHAVNGATPGRVNTDEQETSDNIPRLNAYIYDFFLGQEMWDCARAMQKNRVNMDPEPGNAEDQMNGTDSKDAGDSKKPHDLPASRVGGSQGAFLLEWFDLFWDIFEAQRRRPQPGQIPNNASRYIEHNTAAQKMRQENQAAMLRNHVMNQMDLQQHMLRPGGMQMNGDNMRKTLLQNRNMGLNAQHVAQMQPMGNPGMRRDPSGMDMDGQRPRTPSSSDNAPSPSKRPRLEGPGPGFNGAGRAMPPQMMMDGRAAAHQNMLKSGMDPQQLGQGQYARLMTLSPSAQAEYLAAYENMRMQGRPGMMGPGMAGQGSPMMGQDLNYSPNGFNGMGTGAANGNHALQDYQMQLMLLEQQNKKRLLMARQEQNNDRPDGQPGGPGYSSPNGSRSGPSPGPGEPMGKRGSPPMGPGGVPQSPMPNGVMQHDRPSPGFAGPQMPPEMLQPKMENGVPPMGPHNVMRVPGPNHNQHYLQAAEMAARARAGAPMPNGPNWPGQPPQPQMMQPSHSQQPAPMGTPQTRAAMPPPQNVPAANAASGRTASPAPSAAPPTPQQTNKANPKKSKKEANAERKKVTKKGPTTTTGATPSAETDAQPPTPTPATPITPQHPSSFSGGKSEAPAPAPTAALNVAPTGLDTMGFDPLQAMDNIDLDFTTMDQSDVLQAFDFDSFLNPDGDGFPMDSMNFTGTMPGADGLEAGGAENP